MVLDRDAYAALRRYCERRGVTFTAWLEAMGFLVMEREQGETISKSLPSERPAIERARAITEERRRRGGPPTPPHGFKVP